MARIIAIVLALLAMGTAGSAGAEPYVSRKLGFQVEFPAPPGIQERVVKTEFGGAKLTRFMASKSYVRAALNVLRYDREPFTPKEAREILEKSVAAQVTSTDVTLIERNNIALGKYPGLEALIAVKRGTRRSYYRQRIYVAGRRKFFLSIIGITKAHVMAPKSSRFFDSFKAW